MMAKIAVESEEYARNFGMAAWHGVSAWLLLAPLAASAIKLAAEPLLRKAGETLETGKESE